MSNETLYGLGGIMLGALGMNKLQTNVECPECISTPLYDDTFRTSFPSMSEYLYFMNDEPTNKPNLWTYAILDGSDGNKYVFTSYGFINDSKYTYSLKKVPLNRYDPLTGPEVISSGLSIQNDERYIGFSTDRGTIIIDTQSTIADFNINLGNTLVKLRFQGRPFWYDAGKKAVIVPNYAFIQNFELIGIVQGQLNIDGTVITVRGFCDIERVNYNYIPSEIIRDNWIVFSSNDGKIAGLLYEQAMFRDGGMYLDTTYVKPTTFETNTINFDVNGVVGDQNVFMYFKNGVVQMKLTRIGYSNIHLVYSFDIYYNGTFLKNGYAVVEHTPIAIPYQIW